MESHRADGGIDLEWGVELIVVSSRDVDEKLSHPWPAEASIEREAVVNTEGLAYGYWNK